MADTKTLFEKMYEAAQTVTTPFVTSTTIETGTEEIKRLKPYKFNNIDEVYESILNEDNTTCNTNFQ